MNKSKQQFYKTTREYLLQTSKENNQTKPSYSSTHAKIHYIKEGPFINSSKVAFK